MAAPAPEEPLYVTWEEGDTNAQNRAMAGLTAALKKYEPVLHASGASVTVRDSFSRQDYEFRRPKDALPWRPKDIIRACMNAYDEFSIVRNAIDLMADFAAQGIDLAHPVEEIERFYKEWFRKVSGPERSERFLNYLYRCGNVFVRRLSGKLGQKDGEEWKRATAAHHANAFVGPMDMAIPDGNLLSPPARVPIPTVPTPPPREIPAKYIFLNPLSIEVWGENIAPFLGQEDWRYFLRLSAGFWDEFRNDRTLPYQMPETLVPLYQGNVQRIPLDNATLSIAHYKRDDWTVWAKPLAYSILPNLVTLRKLRLADNAALDSAVAYIRLWKLGDIANRILPTEAAIARLANMLAANVGGGGMDLVWGPELTLEETSTASHQFLGEAKYVPTLAAIREGLGLPAAGEQGFTNKFVNMKTLLERLSYGRGLLRSFWEYEVRLVQKAMSFKKPATLLFDRMVLTDEAAEKALLIQLYDRMGISLEGLQRRFGECPEIEAVRLRREAKRRKSGRMPRKAGPWNNPAPEEDLLKIFAQLGVVTPGEAGVELETKPKGEKIPLELQADNAPPPAPATPGKKGGKKGKGQPQQGRPLNSDDTKKRKQKRVTPRTAASAVVWAQRAQESVHGLAAPAYLKALGKDNLRQLTDDEAKKFEQFKWAALHQFNLGEEVGEANFANAVSREMPVPAQTTVLLGKVLAGLTEPTAEAVRRVRAAVVGLWKAANDGPAAEAGDTVDGSPEVLGTGGDAWAAEEPAWGI